MDLTGKSMKNGKYLTFISELIFFAFFNNKNDEKPSFFNLVIQVIFGPKTQAKKKQA